MRRVPTSLSVAAASQAAEQRRLPEARRGRDQGQPGPPGAPGPGRGGVAAPAPAAAAGGRTWSRRGRAGISAPLARLREEARTCIRSPGRPKMLSTSAGPSPALPNQCGSWVSNSTASPTSSTRSWSPRIEPHPAGQDVEPLVAVVGARFGVDWFGGDHDLPGLDAARVPGQRQHGAPVDAPGLEPDPRIADLGRADQVVQRHAGTPAPAGAGAPGSDAVGRSPAATACSSRCRCARRRRST